MDFGLSHKQLFGEHSFRIPLNLVAQDQGENLTSFIGFSELNHFEHLQDVDFNKNQVLIIGEILVRPHYIIETNRLTGMGLSAIGVDSSLTELYDDDNLLLDNVSHFKHRKASGNPAEWAKNDMQTRMQYGIYACHIPFWAVVQGSCEDDNGCLVMGSSKTNHLLYGSNCNHTILKSDAVIRPHMIYESDAAIGSGVSGIVTGGALDIQKKGELIFVDKQILSHLMENKA